MNKGKTSISKPKRSQQVKLTNLKTDSLKRLSFSSSDKIILREKIHERLKRVKENDTQDMEDIKMIFKKT